MARKKVTSVPALADWGAVDNALRDIRECQHTLAEMAVQRDRQIDSIKADYAQGALPLQNRVKALESEVKAYVDLHRAELDGKSRALNFGTVGYRVSSKLMPRSRRLILTIQRAIGIGMARLAWLICRLHHTLYTAPYNPPISGKLCLKPAGASSESGRRRRHKSKEDLLVKTYCKPAEINIESLDFIKEQVHLCFTGKRSKRRF